jgi:hypothetical protein
MHKNDKTMRPITAILLALLLVAPMLAKAENTSPSTPAPYVFALQTADSFLWAWINRDAEAGFRLISDRLAAKIKKEKNEEWFKDYMVGVSNPHHHSFEIGPGKIMNHGRLSFPVVLYEHYTSEPKAFKYKSRIEVVREGDVWRVDRLPTTPGDE